MFLASNMSLDYWWIGCPLALLAAVAPFVLVAGAARSCLTPAPIAGWFAAFLLLEAGLCGYVAYAYLRSPREHGLVWVWGWGGIVGAALAPAIACRELAKHGWLVRPRRRRRRR